MAKGYAESFPGISHIWLSDIISKEMKILDLCRKTSISKLLLNELWIEEIFRLIVELQWMW